MNKGVTLYFRFLIYQKEFSIKNSNYESRILDATPKSVLKLCHLQFSAVCLTFWSPLGEETSYTTYREYKLIIDQVKIMQNNLELNQ